MFYGKKFDSLEDLEQAIHEYIDFYNNRRFQKKLGCLAPVEFRNQASNCI
ncbi:IS3 family transposase [Petrotoga sp. 9PW.55.5.1]|nr:IS3 family transposase [Petrotoga sp. 9PW.55.5.1]